MKTIPLSLTLFLLSFAPAHANSKYDDCLKKQAQGLRISCGHLQMSLPEAQGKAKDDEEALSKTYADDDRAEADKGKKIDEYGGELEADDLED